MYMWGGLVIVLLIFFSRHQSFPLSVCFFSYSFLVFPFIVALERRLRYPDLCLVWFGFGFVIDVHNVNFVEFSRLCACVYLSSKIASLYLLRCTSPGD